VQRCRRMLLPSFLFQATPLDHTTTCHQTGRATLHELRRFLSTLSIIWATWRDCRTGTACANAARPQTDRQKDKPCAAASTASSFSLLSNHSSSFRCFADLFFPAPPFLPCRVAIFTDVSFVRDFFPGMLLSVHYTAHSCWEASVDLAPKLRSSQLKFENFKTAQHDRSDTCPKIDCLLSLLSDNQPIPTHGSLMPPTEACST
jgi:hypothetical protein